MPRETKAAAELVSYCTTAKRINTDEWMQRLAQRITDAHRELGGIDSVEYNWTTRELQVVYEKGEVRAPDPVPGTTISTEELSELLAIKERFALWRKITPNFRIDDSKREIIVDDKQYFPIEDLRSARWALRSAVNLIPRQLNKDIAIERFIMNQDALCELTPMPEITPSCDTCRFARGYSCCAHPTTIPFPSRRWCGEHQEKR